MKGLAIPLIVMSGVESRTDFTSDLMGTQRRCSSKHFSCWKTCICYFSLKGQHLPLLEARLNPNLRGANAIPRVATWGWGGGGGCIKLGIPLFSVE